MTTQQIKIRVHGIPGLAVGDVDYDADDDEGGTAGGDVTIVSLTAIAKSGGWAYWLVISYDDATETRPFGLYWFYVGLSETEVTFTPGVNRYGGSGSASSGSGQFALPVLATDADDVAIPRAVVSVADSDGNSLGIFGTTDALGQVTLYLDPEDYVIRVTAYPTHTAKTASVTIAAADHDTETIELAVVETTPPGTGGLCRVRTPVREASAVAVGARWEAQLVDENQAVGNDLVARSVTRAKTDATGYADLLLPQGLKYKIEGFHGNHRFFSAEYTVPAEDEAYLAASL